MARGIPDPRELGWDDLLPGLQHVTNPESWGEAWGFAFWVPPPFSDAWCFSCVKFAQGGLASVLTHFGLWLDYRAQCEGLHESEIYECRALESRVHAVHGRLMALDQPDAAADPSTVPNLHLH